MSTGRMHLHQLKLPVEMAEEIDVRNGRALPRQKNRVP